MRIAVISQLYWPEKSAASNRLDHIVSCLAKNHDISVLSGVPNYPLGKVYPPYKVRWRFEERRNGVKIIRSWSIPAENRGKVRRIINYFSFFFSGLLNGLFSLRKPNIIIASSPQLLNGVLGLFLARVKKADFVLDIRDLWPDSLVALNLLKKGILLNFLFYLEKVLYRGSKRIIVVSDGMAKILIRKGVKENKISVIHNAVDTEYFKPLTVSRQELKLLDKKYIACYAGNHSAAQNIEALFDGVVESHKNNEPIFYLFIGEGELKNELMERSSKLSLANIQFLPNQSRESLLRYIAAADVCITSLAGNPFFHHALPTKTLEYMSCGKPVLFFGDSFFGDIIATHKLGVRVFPNRPDLIPPAIMSICNNPGDRDAMGSRARQYVVEHHGDQILCNKISSLIAQL